MRRLTIKEFIIEEPFEVEEADGTVNKYVMQITPEELKEIKEMVSNVEEEGVQERQKRFEEIIYKDNIKEVKEKAKGHYYDILTGDILSFFLQLFVKQGMTIMESAITNTQKNGKK